MVRMTGKRALMEMLRAEGVDYIFGNPGTSESPIMDALEDYPDIKYMLTTQEGVAMGMGDAYARATGKPAFVNLHIETGLANGISLLTNAYEGGTPLVLTSANQDIRKLSNNRSDLVQMVEQFTKWSAEVTHPEQLPGIIRRAFNEAKTPPTGPTYVAFSANALDDEGEMDIIPSSKGYFRIGPDKTAIAEAARLLKDAQDPVIIVGDRAAQSESSQEIVKVAEMLGARVYATNYSEMNYPTGHPQFLGALNPSMPDSKKIIGSSDVVLAVGTNVFSGFFYFSGPALGANTKLIHVDQAYEEIGKSEPTDVGIIADPKIAMVELIDALESKMSGAEKEAAKGRMLTVSEEKASLKRDWQSRLQRDWDNQPMTADRMMHEISNALPDDTIIADDSITSRGSIHSSMEFNEPGSIYGIRGGALGWGMGGVLGVKLAYPERPVVAVVGDGSSMMTVQALWTAANANIPVVYIICNNSAYRVLKLNMNVYKRDVLGENPPNSQYMGTDFPIRLNIAGIAEAIGVYGRQITDPTELSGAVRDALASGKPAVLDVVIDGTV